MKVFESTGEFVDFLKDNSVIKDVTPFADELIQMHSNVHKGCKCKLKAREGQRDHVYITMLNNVLLHNKELQDLYKKYGGFTSAQFKVNGEIMLEI